MAKTIENILAEKGVLEVPADIAAFYPLVPDTIEQTGLNTVLIEDLICKALLQHGLLTGKKLAEIICLPLPIFSDLLYELKNRLLVIYQSTAGINDFVYALSEKGKEKALTARASSAYTGSAPVPYAEYLTSIDQQALSNESPNLTNIKLALAGLVLSDKFYSLLGPAVNSGRGLFLYGKPGNGKTEIAMRVASCFQEHVFIPKTLFIEGELVKLYDPQCHQVAHPQEADEIVLYDKRWIRIKRPAVVVGGEMDMSSLELGYNPHTKVCEASLQMKGNSGVFVVDDFGRQKVSPEELLNRWILPLEKRIDYLTLPNGTKFQVPFDSLLIFCTNLDPTGLMDEAFLRRIPYKIEVVDPTEEQFNKILREAAEQYRIPYSAEMANYIIDRHFKGKRPMRGCHPRDILRQLKNIALFEGREPQMQEQDIDTAVSLYFAVTQQQEVHTNIDLCFGGGTGG